MRYQADTLDYFKLIKEARKVNLPASSKVVRVALLADFATQFLVPLLKALFARNGVVLELYEAGYDSIDTEILDPGSPLYAFKPRFTVILQATEKLKAKLYAAGDRQALAADTADRTAGLWEALKQNGGGTVIQGNYVLPSERAFGNYEAKVDGSIGAAVADINRRLAEAARGSNNVLLCDIDHLAAEVGRRNWADDTLWVTAKGLCRMEHLPLLAQSLVDTVLAAEGIFTKCVVLDLDNTLWGGVIGDDGLEGIQLGEYDQGQAFVAFQRFLLELKRRGIILAVVSKNDQEVALKPFREHPNMVLREEDISVFIANWDNKADNIRAVQKVLNIGFDSMVFVDDNPFERGLVREFIPEILVPEMPEDPSLYVRTLGALNLFETASYSAADRQRPGQYREEAQRELAKQVFTNIDEYLRSLEMTVRLDRFTPVALPRIAQLIQRSNQFNLTTRRLGEAECEALMKDEVGWLPFSVTLTDKYGDYGLVSVVILKLAPDAIEIDTYLMSCRVLRRGLEQFVMNAIFAEATRRGAKQVVGRYLPTAKNGIVKDFYAGFGFAKTSETESETVWGLSPADYAAKPAFMTPLGDGI
jgi:FkbH-like protein